MSTAAPQSPTHTRDAWFVVGAVLAVLVLVVAPRLRSTPTPTDAAAGNHTCWIWQRAPGDVGLCCEPRPGVWGDDHGAACDGRHPPHGVAASSTR